MSSKKVSNEEALEASEILARILGIDLDKLEVEKYKALRPVDQLIHDLEKEEVLVPSKGKPRKRLTKRYKHSPSCSGKCGGRCGKNHWTARKKKRREYYRTVERKADIRKRVEGLKTGKGMFGIVTKTWGKRRIEHFSLEEWLTRLYPRLDGRVPSFTRYDTGKGYTLDNMVMRDETGTVVWDGKEELLRELGYIL